MRQILWDSILGWLLIFVLFPIFLHTDWLTLIDDKVVAIVCMLLDQSEYIQFNREGGGGGMR